MADFGLYSGIGYDTRWQTLMPGQDKITPPLLRQVRPMAAHFLRRAQVCYPTQLILFPYIRVSVYLCN